MEQDHYPAPRLVPVPTGLAPDRIQPGVQPFRHRAKKKAAEIAYGREGGGRGGEGPRPSRAHRGRGDPAGRPRPGARTRGRRARLVVPPVRTRGPGTRNGRAGGPGG